MADVVREAAEALNAVRSRYKTTEVERDVPPRLDLGNLALFDESSVTFAPGEVISDRLKEMNRDNAQLLINAVFSLPTKREGQIVVVDLPAATTALPREKPLPKDAPSTRWERFAKSKGIQKKKRSRMIWDEAKQAWLPRFGYKRANDDQNDWAIEVPANANPYEDQFEKRAEEKKKRIEKNTANRVRNQETAERLERKSLRALKNGASRLPAPTEPLTKNAAKQIVSTVKEAARAQADQAARDSRDALKKELGIKLAVTRTSTASLGRFDKQLKTDKPIKTKQIKESAVGNPANERKRALEAVEKFAPKNGGEVNVRKAVNFMQQENERKNKKQRRR